MLPTVFDSTPGHAARNGRVALVILQVDEPHRAALAAWRAELDRLIKKHAACPARTLDNSLRSHLLSALQGAGHAICEACAPERGQVITEAAETIRHYFKHAGDARAAAMRFPAVVEMGDFLRGPSPAETLGGLASQAKDAGVLIGRILEGGEIFHFSGPKA